MRARPWFRGFSVVASFGLHAGFAQAQSSAPPSTGWMAPASSRASEAPSASPAPLASTRPSSSPAPAAPAHHGISIRLYVPGEFQLRVTAQASLPLMTTPGTTTNPTLGQQVYEEQWLRLSPELHIGDSFHLLSQFDIVRGSLFGDSTHQVELSRDSRDYGIGPFPHGWFDFRWFYVEWNAPFGLVRVGQQPSHWGLGIVANDGAHPQVFGDNRLGDLSERVALATRPFGRTSDLVLAVAGDLVYRDRLASLLSYTVPRYDGADPSGAITRTLGDDRAWQGILSVFYQDHACTTECERKRVGVYAVYRDWTNRLGNYLRVFVGDAYGRWEWPTPDGRGRVYAAAELAVIAGIENMTSTTQFDTNSVLQFGGATEIGLERDGQYHFVLRAGYASGDANPLEGTQRRFTFNPDYHVGLILFPELMAWQTARSASIAVDNRLVGRPTNGADLLPTSGGVANAAYLYPTAVVNVNRWIDVRLGAVVGVSTSDVVDPVSLTVVGMPQNYRGGNSVARDLGLELDAGMMGRYPLSAGLSITGGVQGGVAFPGHAFDDAHGNGIGTQWLARGLAGLVYN